MDYSTLGVSVALVALAGVGLMMYSKAALMGDTGLVLLGIVITFGGLCGALYAAMEWKKQ